MQTPSRCFGSAISTLPAQQSPLARRVAIERGAARWERGEGGGSRRPRANRPPRGECGMRLMSEWPTGTVTFLFTDIEGSTRLWEQHPEAMEPALARHETLASEVIARRRGVLVKHR